jgi:hypothetical protein
MVIKLLLFMEVMRFMLAFFLTLKHHMEAIAMGRLRQLTHTLRRYMPTLKTAFTLMMWQRQTFQTQPRLDDSRPLNAQGW